MTRPAALVLALLVLLGCASSAGAQTDAITSYTLPPDTLARAEALYRTRVAMLMAGTVYGFAALMAVLALRVAPRIRDLAKRVSRRRFAQVLVFAPVFLIVLDLLGLPLGIYGQYLDRSYGLSVQGWGSWFWDWTKGEIIGTAIATLLVWGLYAVLRRSPRRWWFYGWLGLIPIVLLLILIAPIYIAPLFDTFTSLEEKQPQLVVELEKVLQRGGVQIERSRMFEMAASDKVTTYNAYVTGIGASKRVVVWDNTSRDMRMDETMFVFGHEMGHYVLQHMWLSLGAAVAALLLQLYLAHRLIDGLLARYGARWDIRGLTDWASLPVLILLLSVFGLIGQPVGAAFSRYLEHQADIYGLEVTHGLTPDSSQAAARAFQKLGEKGLVYPTPHPLYVFWAFDHPPVGERVRFAAEYQPWARGERGKYVQP
ncbi:MAG: M48 family metallopeptidase [Vicinamibacterales bacterium]